MHAEAIEYRPMSFEEYLELPREVRAEWVDGVAIVMTPGKIGHQVTEVNLVMALRNSLNGVLVLAEGGIRTGARRYRFGDVVVLPAAGVDLEAMFTEIAPVLVVEVLSSSTRREDTLRKTTEYLQAGVLQYWLVDRREPSLIILERNESGWDELLVLDTEHPTGSVVVGDHGTVELDLNALIAV